MNHQHPSDRTHVTAGPPAPEFWILPKNAKRTQSAPKATSIMQNEPNSTSPRPKNAKRTQFTPQPPRPTPKNAKRTQFHKPDREKKRNEPNSSLPSVHPPSPHPQFRQNEPNLPSRQLPTATFSAKRTQFRPHRTCGYPKKCKTNPIPQAHRTKNAKRTLKRTHAAGVPPLYLTPVFQPGSSHNQKERNEPNLPSTMSRLYNVACWVTLKISLFKTPTFSYNTDMH